MEITNLVIPTYNDNMEMVKRMSHWILENLGPHCPLHFSRFHPDYRMKNLPPTPAGTLDRAREIGQAEGLHHIYIGNLSRPGAADTHCPGCDRLLVARHRYTILENHLSEGKCPDCMREVHGIWD